MGLEGVPRIGALYCHHRHWHGLRSCGGQRSVSMQTLWSRHGVVTSTIYRDVIKLLFVCIWSAAAPAPSARRSSPCSAGGWPGQRRLLAGRKITMLVRNAHTITNK